MMSTEEIAEKLCAAIKLGEFTQVRNLVDTITEVEVIRDIEAKFPERDPLVLAIDCREQTIALYLIEKQFNHRLTYVWPGQHCDQWCFSQHGDDPCPTEYDSLLLAHQKHMLKFTNVLSDVRAGLRKPGDGLALMQHPGIKREDSSVSNKRVRSVSAGDVHTACQTARRRLKELGLTLHTVNGESVIHLCSSASMVHVAASLQVNVNSQNFEGDTALHLAVREQSAEVAVALLMNGADPTLRNKLGQTPLDISSSYMKTAMQPFKCGLLQALQRGEAGTVQRLLRLWVNPHTLLTRDGRTGMEVARARRGESQGHTKCFNALNAAAKTLDVTYAVLSEDVPSLKRLLRTETGWSLNNRFKDKQGGTLLSCAIEQNNLEVVQLLIETQQCSLNMRMREHPETDATVPLLFKTLSKDCREDIWSYVDYHVDCYQATERDQFGNTALLRAIVNGRSAGFVRRFLRRYATAVFHRNAEGQNAREMAAELDRRDIMAVIDNFVVGRGNTCFTLELPVNFYGQDNTNIFNEEGQTLLAAAEQCEGSWREDVIRAVLEYPQVEEVGTRLHKAASQGRLKRVAKYNTANYVDRNGLTALTRAIVYEQLEAAEILITERPVLKQIPDNCNRYPLHYAYALPEDRGPAFIRLLLQRNPEDIETRRDCRGREPAEYKDLRGSDEVIQMLHDARTLNTHAQRCPGLGVLPEGAVNPEPLVQASLRLNLKDAQSATTNSS